ncbi:DUF4282 domain-containing protein [Pseudactinotalea sp. Z1739]|uniref:DUF4282 domain-containing protein n=1 Tax=Pseudactinotalea sp. Z1739 TaxID=3413028 RepID=UPI003C7E6387
MNPPEPQEPSGAGSADDGRSQAPAHPGDTPQNTEGGTAPQGAEAGGEGVAYAQGPSGPVPQAGPPTEPPSQSGSAAAPDVPGCADVQDARAQSSQGGYAAPPGGYAQGGDATPHGGQGGYGQPQGGYGAPQGGYAGQQGGHEHGGYGAPQGGYGTPQRGYGAPQGGPPQPGSGAPHGAPGYPQPGTPLTGSASGPGLFDLTFATPLAPRIARLGFISLCILGGLIALSGLVEFIQVAVATSMYGGGWTVAVYFVNLLVTIAIAVALVVLGRMGIELVLAVVAGHERDKGSQEGRS